MSTPNGPLPANPGTAGTSTRMGPPKAAISRACPHSILSPLRGETGDRNRGQTVRGDREAVQEILGRARERVSEDPVRMLDGAVSGPPRIHDRASASRSRTRDGCCSAASPGASWPRSSGRYGSKSPDLFAESAAPTRRTPSQRPAPQVPQVAASGCGRRARCREPEVGLIFGAATADAAPSAASARSTAGSSTPWPASPAPAAGRPARRPRTPPGPSAAPGSN